MTVLTEKILLDLVHQTCPVDEVNAGESVSLFGLRNAAFPDNGNELRF